MDWLLFGQGGICEIGRTRSRGWKNFGRRGVVGLENWTIFMHVICVSSLSYLSSKDFHLNLVFLVCDIPCLNWIRRFTLYTVIIRGNTDLKKLCIQTLFMQYPWEKYKVKNDCKEILLVRFYFPRNFRRIANNIQSKLSLAKSCFQIYRKNFHMKNNMP